MIWKQEGGMRIAEINRNWYNYFPNTLIKTINKNTNKNYYFIIIIK